MLSAGILLTTLTKFEYAPGFALGIEVKILFAPFAKRLERKARSNAQNILYKFIRER